MTPSKLWLLSLLPLAGGIPQDCEEPTPTEPPTPTAADLQQPSQCSTPSLRFVVDGGLRQAQAPDGSVFALGLRKLTDGSSILIHRYGWAEALYIQVEGSRSTPAFAVTPGGGFLLASSSTSGEVGSWLTLLDAAGGILWERFIAGQTIRAIERHPQGGYLIAGDELVDGQHQPFASQLDSEANPLWHKTYHLVEGGIAWATIPEDGGAVLAGGAAGRGWMARLGPGGDALWELSIPTDEGSALLALGSTASGDLVAAGRQGVPTAGGILDGAWAIGVTPDGVVRWQNLLAVPEGEDVQWDPYYCLSTGVAPTQKGGAVISGACSEQFHYGGGHDGFLWKVDSDGQLDWTTALEFHVRGTLDEWDRPPAGVSLDGEALISAASVYVDFLESTGEVYSTRYLAWERCQ